MLKRTLKVLMATSALTFAAGAVQAQQGELYLYNWSNYFPPELLQKFEADTGIKATLDVYDSNESLLAKMQAGGGAYDVVVPSDYMVDIMVQQGLLQEVDAPSMANFAGVKEAFRDPWYDPGRKYTVPYMWGTTGFSYDTAAVEGGKVDDSWKSIFDPEGPLAGKIAMLNDPVEVYVAAAMYLGIDRCTENPEEAAKIYDLLAAQKPAVVLYNSDGTIERMIAGEVAAHMQWNGAAHRTKEGRPTVEYVYPREGINFWADNFAVPKDAPHPENAKIFLNWILDPANMAAASNFTGYMNAIDGSDAFLDPALADDPAVNMPDEYASRLNAQKNCSPASLELRDRVWTRLKG